MTVLQNVTEAQFRRQINRISQIRAGGLAFATILTLLLTPSFLMISANLSRRLSAARATSAAETPEPGTLAPSN